MNADDSKTGMTRRDFLGIAGMASALLLGLPATATALEASPVAGKRVCLIPSAHVAGTTHVSGIEAVAEELCEGDVLTLEREPDNAFDCWAIRAFDARGNRVGFIPRAVNEIPARLMDAGFRVFAQVTDVELIRYWYKISIEVWLEAYGRPSPYSPTVCRKGAAPFLHAISKKRSLDSGYTSGEYRFFVPLAREVEKVEKDQSGKHQAQAMEYGSHQLRVIIGGALMAGDGWYHGALRRAERGLKRMRQELCGEY